VHGPDGCTHHNFSLLHATSLDNDRIQLPSLVSTGLSENDIIFGGEGALDRVLDDVTECGPEAIFVLSTCVVETIGDDIDMVCGTKTGIPIIRVPTAGFLGGSFQTGVNNALIAIAGMAEPVHRNGKVNIIGEKNLEYEIDENLAEITRLLGLLGLSVNIRFVHDITLREVNLLGAARLNILRDPSLIPVGEFLKERFNIPFVPAYPVGIAGTQGFLESVGRACNIDPGNAVGQEQKFRNKIFNDFADIAGATVAYSPAYPDPDGDQLIRDVAETLGMNIVSTGRPVPAPVTPPVGTTGIKRLLHRWRRALNA